MGNMLTRADMLKKTNLKVEKVPFENGDFVFVREMTGHERDVFEASVLREKREGGKIKYETILEDFRSKLAVVTVCDEEGNLAFQQEDWKILTNSMSAAMLEDIINVAQRINKISKEDKEKLVKNSEAGPAGNSTSDSAEN